MQAQAPRKAPRSPSPARRMRMRMEQYRKMIHDSAYQNNDLDLRLVIAIAIAIAHCACSLYGQVSRRGKDNGKTRTVVCTLQYCTVRAAAVSEMTQRLDARAEA